MNKLIKPDIAPAFLPSSFPTKTKDLRTEHITGMAFHLVARFKFSDKERDQVEHATLRLLRSIAQDPAYAKADNLIEILSIRGADFVYCEHCRLRGIKTGMPVGSTFIQRVRRLFGFFLQM